MGLTGVVARGRVSGRAKGRRISGCFEFGGPGLVFGWLAHSVGGQPCSDMARTTPYGLRAPGMSTAKNHGKSWVWVWCAVGG